MQKELHGRPSYLTTECSNNLKHFVHLPQPLLSSQDMHWSDTHDVRNSMVEETTVATETFVGSTLINKYVLLNLHSGVKVHDWIGTCTITQCSTQSAVMSMM